MRAAVFDVDRTLLDGMSGYLFATHLWRTGAMPLAGRLRTVRAMALYRLGLAHELIIVEAGVTCYAGLTAARVDELADRAVREVMQQRLYVEAIRAVRERLAAGDRVAFATGSSVFIARALVRLLGAHEGIGTDSERDGERLLPKMKWPPCAKEGKRELVRQWLEREGIDPVDATLYTDNGIDQPLIELVGGAIAVNPDADLARLAQERGLPVVHWTTPSDPTYKRTGTSWPLKE
jgi:putative phosphoserine phosphatase/1-acylglycerol-3-phosphate O-acyltransferase